MGQRRGHRRPREPTRPGPGRLRRGRRQPQSFPAPPRPRLSRPPTAEAPSPTGDRPHVRGGRRRPDGRGVLAFRRSHAAAMRRRRGPFWYGDHGSISGEIRRRNSGQGAIGTPEAQSVRGDFSGGLYESTRLFENLTPGYVRGRPGRRPQDARLLVQWRPGSLGRSSRRDRPPLSPYDHHRSPPGPTAAPALLRAVDGATRRHRRPPSRLCRSCDGPGADHAVSRLRLRRSGSRASAPATT